MMKDQNGPRGRTGPVGAVSMSGEAINASNCGISAHPQLLPGPDPRRATTPEIGASGGAEVVPYGSVAILLATEGCGMERKRVWVDEHP